MSTNNFSGEWKRLTADGAIESRRPPYHEIMPQRKREAAAAAKLFGTTPIHLDHPQRHYMRDDGVFAEVRYGCERPNVVPPDVPTIITAYEHEPSVQRLAEIILDKDPEAVITHGVTAGDIEHFATCLLTTRAYRKAAKAGYDGRLLQWQELNIEIHGPLNYRWNTFVDVSTQWEEKLAAIGMHACQIPDPFRLEPRNWGPACGCRHAEVFNLIAGDSPPGPDAAFTIEILSNMR